MRPKIDSQSLNTFPIRHIARFQCHCKIDQISCQSHDGPHLLTVTSRMGRTLQDVRSLDVPSVEDRASEP